MIYPQILLYLPLVYFSLLHFLPYFFTPAVDLQKMNQLSQFYLKIISFYLTVS